MKNYLNMERNKNNIEKNAGIVWNLLQSSKMSWKDLSENTSLNFQDLVKAIGRLAGENKIHVSPYNGIFYYEINRKIE